MTGEESVQLGSWVEQLCMLNNQVVAPPTMQGMALSAHLLQREKGPGVKRHYPLTYCEGCPLAPLGLWITQSPAGHQIRVF